MFKSIWNRIKQKYYEMKMKAMLFRNARSIAKEIKFWRMVANELSGSVGVAETKIIEEGEWEEQK